MTSSNSRRPGLLVVESNIVDQNSKIDLKVSHKATALILVGARRAKKCSMCKTIVFKNKSFIHVVISTF